MFLGEHRHSIDSKGRLIVPVKYRELLGESFKITKGLDGCLYIYPQAEWDEFEQKLNSLPVSKRDARRMARHFLSSADHVEVDKQGRILVPASLRAFAELEKDVVFAGVGKKIEVWSLEKWEAVAMDYDDIDEVVENLSDFGIDF